VRAAHPGGRGDGDADDVGAGRDLAGDVNVVRVRRARPGLERGRERGAKTQPDLFVARQRDQDDPAGAARCDRFLGDRVQSL